MLTRHDRTRVQLTQSNDELIDALVPNSYKAAHIKKQWRERTEAEIGSKVQKEVEVAMMLAGMRQQKSGIDVNDLLSTPANDEAVGRLAGFMTQDQIKQMQTLLEAVSNKIRSQPEMATAQMGKDLDDDMDSILGGDSSPLRDPAEQDEGQAEDERDPKRQKTSSGTLTHEDEAL